MCVCNMDNSIRRALFPAGKRHGLGAQNPAKPSTSVPGAPSPEGFSAGRRSGLGARNPASPSTSVPGAPTPGGFSTGWRSGLGARNPAKPCLSVSFAPSPGGFSTGRRHGLGAPKPANPCTSVSGAPSPPSDERRKEMNGGPVGDLRSSLLIFIIPKRKELSGVHPASAQLFTSSFQKERIDDERPHRSPFVVNSYHLLPGRPGSLIPGPFPPCRSRPSLTSRVKKRIFMAMSGFSP